MENSYDLIVVGAGIGGVVALHYARQAGLDAVVLEKSSVAGGLWAHLPAWQDIQQPGLDWTVDGLPIAGERQPHIHQNILSWIDRFDLAAGIELNTPVINAEHVDGKWTVHTPNQVIHAPHLLAATGVQNTPVVPSVSRTNQAVSEYHSSELRDPEVLRRREVVVVGGGASAYDLIELCLTHGAKSIRWVCRSAKWMAPSGKQKNVAGAIRWLGALQMQGMDPKAISKQVNDDLIARYQRYGIEELIPGTPFDFDIHQLIPGRRQMIQAFDEIEYHCAEVTAINEDSVELSDKQRFKAEIILWGTGYDMDLSMFRNPELSEVRRAADLVNRCASKFVSLSEPNLYFLAPGIANGIGSLPWAYAHAARAIMSHIKGDCLFGSKPVSRHLNHFDLIRFLAEQNPVLYGTEGWPDRFVQLACQLPEDASLPLP